MNITRDSIGKYFTRSKELSKNNDNLMTSIIRINAVKDDGSFSASLIHNCQPIHNFDFPKEADDGYWHDITSLVFKANSVIPFPHDKCKYDTNTSAMYRNYLKELQQIESISVKSSINNIVVIGVKEDRVIKFNSIGDQVIAVDDEGFIITYGGFCSHNVTEEDIVMRVIRLNPNNEQFYLAEKVIGISNSMHSSDVKTAYEMVSTAKANIKPASTVSSVISDTQSVKNLYLQENKHTND